jgi:hypothetical protein
VIKSYRKCRQRWRFDVNAIINETDYRIAFADDAASRRYVAQTGNHKVDRKLGPVESTESQPHAALAIVIICTGNSRALFARQLRRLSYRLRQVIGSFQRNPMLNNQDFTISVVAVDLFLSRVQRETLCKSGNRP